MKIAVVDDLAEDRLHLVSNLTEYCEKNCLEFNVEEFDSGEKFLKDFYADKYDIIFLDIYLSGVDGISTAEQLREIDNEGIIIFTTTSKYHAVKSYRVRALDYMVKPYEYDLFSEIMSYAYLQLDKKTHYIEIKEGRIMRKLLLKDIIYTDYYNHYIQIHTTERVVKSYMSFPEFHPMLLEFPQFLRCYRNCIVNLDEVVMLKGRDFEMSNGEFVPIKKEWYKEIHQKYADYVFYKFDTKK